jgi:hypothetical protein
MAYGTVKVDNITFDNGGSDQNVTVSGLYRATTSGVTVTGTISGAVLVGTTTVSGATVTGNVVQGTTVQGVSGTFTSLTGTTTTGTTANFASGVFTTRVSGTIITGDTGQFTSGTFVSLTGTTITGTTINAVTVSSTTGTFTSLTGTTITGTTINGVTVAATTGSFTSLTGTTTSGTTANFVSGVFTTQVSGTTVTGTTSNFTSGNFATLSGATATFTSGIIASGTAAAPSLAVLADLDTGLFSPGANQVAVATNGTQRLLIDSSGRLLIGTSTSTDYYGGTAKSYITDQGGANLPLALETFRNDEAGAYLILGHSRSGTAGNYTILQSNDGLGLISFNGSDGTDLVSVGATIKAEVDGTPGANDMPGRLVFSTTADGASSPTERLRIDSSGRLLVGTSTARSSGALGTGLHQVESATFAISQLFSNSATVDGSYIGLWKSRGGTVGSTTIVQSGDIVGGIYFGGSDGTNLVTNATITSEVDGTPGANDMPGRIVLATTADGRLVLRSGCG